VIGTGITHPGYDIDITLVEPCATRLVGYRCPAGHHFELRFAAEADALPPTWACRRCGDDARTDDAAVGEPVLTRAEQYALRPRKTHSDMLHERRTMAELEALLDERLALLRGLPEEAVA
jgi:hypothetical protein